MSTLDWAEFFEQEGSEGSEQISASSPVQLIAPTRIEARIGKGDELELFYAGDEPDVLLEDSTLEVGKSLQRVLLVKAFPPNLKHRTLVWCRFPYVSDLFESSRFLPGVKDRKRRAAYREKAEEAARAAFDTEDDNSAALAARTIAEIKRLNNNLSDNESQRLIAMMGVPEQRFADILRDRLANSGKEEGEQGPRDKQVFKKFLSMTELWEHRGEHPDLVPLVEIVVGGEPKLVAPPNRNQLAEFRWGLLPAREAVKAEFGDKARFQITEEEQARAWTDTADLLFAKAVVSSSSRLQDALERALLGFPDRNGPNRELHEVARNRAERVLEYAVERALCGPHSMTRINACMPKTSKAAPSVATAALRIFRNELIRQNRRFNTWGAHAFQTDDPPEVDTTSVPERFEDYVLGVLTALQEGEVSVHMLEQTARHLLDDDVTEAEVYEACAGILVLVGCGFKPNWLPRAFERSEELRSRVSSEATQHALSEVLAARP